MRVEKRRIARTGLEISSVSFGCWGISGGWSRRQPDDEIARVLDAARERGVSCFDTAPVYGNGWGERILGARPWRNEVVIATKLSLSRKPTPPLGPIEQYYSRASIERGVASSLRRLRRDRIDVLQLHTWHETWEADPRPTFDVLEELKEAGTIGTIGVSLPSTPRQGIDGLLRWSVVDVLQVPYSLCAQWAAPLIGEAAASGVGVLVRSAFCHGVLTGALDHTDGAPADDTRRRKISGPWGDAIGNLAAEFRRRTGIDETMMAPYALSFAASLDGVTSVIVGMRKLEHVMSNLAPDAPFLNPDQLEVARGLASRELRTS